MERFCLTPVLRLSCTRLSSSKPYSEIPHPKLYPVVGCLFELIKHGHLAIYQKHLYQTYGPIRRIRLPGYESVSINDPIEYRKKIFGAEGSTPRGAASFVWPLAAYFDTCGGSQNSVLYAEGSNWKEIRSKLQHNFFSPIDSETYLPNMHKTLQQISENAPKWGNQLDQFTSRIGMELICNVLFNINLAAVTPQIKPEDEHFIKSALLAFEALSPLFLGPLAFFHKKFYNISPTYKKFQRAFDIPIKRTSELMELVEKAVEEQKKTGQPNFTDSSYYASLIKNNQNISREQSVINIGTMYFAGVDTTSNTLQWLLYNLSRTPNAQERLASELKSVLNGRNLMPGDSAHLPFLSQCMKESFRVTPTASGTTRWITKDTEMMGYMIPAGTMVTWDHSMASDPNVFEDPTLFKPERFDEEAKKKRVEEGKDKYYDHPFFTTNFGFGPRMCLGARVAQAEVRAVVSRLVQDYKISMDPPDQVIKPGSGMITQPTPSPKLKFTPRV